MKSLPAEIILSGEEGTLLFAEKFAGYIAKGEVISLNGNLGTGKTFFVKGVCRNFGIDGVNSPSFSIVNEYSGKFRVVHFDFYRIENVKELYDIGIEEYFGGDAVIFIEWGDKFESILPAKRFELSFEYIDEITRRLKIKRYEK